ncbi:MAG: hypothetical protein DRQ35_05005 [Gammaproteobacteria bacterium]|nr:MAG: hypothetical protein DRQ35_05005 [Gammaproteobacteria bacterium]
MELDIQRKTCDKCGITGELSLFRKHKTYEDGYQPKCKPCHAEEARVRREVCGNEVREGRRAYYKENTEKYRWSTLKRLYGITEFDYNRIFEEQEGCCEICCIHQKDLKKALSVDHNHNTGEVRGLLCQACNTGLGNFRDRPETLLAAIQYLEGRGHYG